MPKTKAKEPELVTEEIEFKVDKFNPTRAAVIEKAETYKKLLRVKIKDKESFEMVSKARKDCKTTRVELKKIGLKIREQAKLFSKKVIEEEKSLIAEIEPLERELELKEEEYKAKQEYEKRKKRYPDFIDQFKELGHDLTEKEYCESDDAGIFAMLQKLKEEKLEKERQEFEAKQAEIRAKEEAIAAKERELKEAEERARIEKEREAAAKKAAAEAKAEAERKHKLELEEKEREAQRKIEEAKEQARKEQEKKEMLARAEEVRKKKELEEQQAKEDFVAWTKEIGFKEGEDIFFFDKETFTHKAYRLIGTYQAKPIVNKEEIEI